MRFLAGCIVAAMATSGVAAAADLPANASTPASIRLSHEFEAYSYLDYYLDKDWWRVNLVKGNAYVVRGLSGSCTTTVSLLDISGKKLGTATCNSSYIAAFEYIAKYTGTYFVEYADNTRIFSYPSYYYADVFNDCAGSKATTCTQAINTDFSTILQYKSDSDWRAINLKGGKVYTASATEGAYFFLSVRKPDGTILAYRSGYYPTFAFYVPSTGKYFVEVKATRDPGFGSTTVRYIVAEGDLTLRYKAAREAALAKGTPAAATAPSMAKAPAPQGDGK